MLILPPGHAQTVSTGYRFSRRERWMLGGVLTTVAVLAVVVIVALATSSQSSGNGCVHVYLPYSTGGQEFYECGAKAKALCSGVNTPGGITGATATAVATQCRRAGLPVG